MSTVEKTPDVTKRVPGHVIYRRVRAERLSYAVTAAGVALGPQLDAGLLSYTGAFGVLAGTGAWLYGKTRNSEDSLGLLTACQRALPVLTGAGMYAANLIAPGFNWWEAASPAAWVGLMSWLAPITRSAGLTLEIPAQRGQVAVPSALPVTYEDVLLQLWDTAALAPGTRLTAIRQLRGDRPDFEAVVVAQRGKAVPKLTETALAAVFDFPEGTVVLRPIYGSGPGRMQLVARPTSEDSARQAEGLHGLWEKSVSASSGAAPGVQLVQYRAEENRLVLHVASPAGKTITLPHAAICSALGIDDPSRLVIESDGVRQAVVSVYRTNPLMNVRRATVEDLTMDSKGRIAIGVCHDGRPARMRLLDVKEGALRGITAGVTGAGKSVLQNLILIGEKRSGVVSWVGDVQGGMSLPEAEGHVDWFAKGPVETLLMLTAAHAVMKYRERISNELGRGDFALNHPWPLLNITLDEINRLLSHPDEGMRKTAAYLIADIQKTGRKVGVGIRLAVQSLHLKDLGDDDAIRQQGKVGALFLMRTASSSTRDMGMDGIAPTGFQLETIPARIYENGQIEALFNGAADDDGQSTAGMAYMFLDGRVFYMRTFFAEKINGVYPHLIELYGDEPARGLTDGEQQAAAAAVTRAYVCRADNPYAAFDTLKQAFGDADPTSETPPFEPSEAMKAAAPAGESVLRDKILDLLADGPKSLKDLRAALPDVSSTSVSNAITGLRGKGRVAPVSRGVWQLAD